MAEPDFQLYFDILQTLERLQVPYVIIGDTELSASFDPDYIDGWTIRLGPNVMQFWVNLKKLVGLDEE